MEDISQLPTSVDSLPMAHGIGVGGVEAYPLHDGDANPLVGHQLEDVVGGFEPFGLVPLRNSNTMDFDVLFPDFVWPACVAKAGGVL